MASMFVLLTLLRAATSVVVLPDRAPKGFNSFDDYHSQTLNQSTAHALATAMASQLLPHGFDHFVLDGGWARSTDADGNVTWHFDEWGRPVAAPDRYDDLARLSREVKGLGLKFGLWTVRGVHRDFLHLRVKGMEQYALGDLVDQEATGGGANGSCLWMREMLGVNMSHPAAMAYYESRVDQLVGTYGADFIKADCMMCAPCYTREIEAFTAAVEQRKEAVVLSYSPGGGNAVDDGKWVAEGKLGSMYRVTTDFHGGWYGWGSLQQSLFIQGNFSAAGLYGANGTWPDPDMLPMRSDWWNRSVEQDDRGETIFAAWTISGAPLMHAGELPADDRTAAYLTNPTARRVHENGTLFGVRYYEGNCTCVGGPTACTIPRDFFPAAPCVAVWGSALDDGFTGGFAAALFNLGENATTATLDLARVGRAGEAAGGVLVTEVWTGRVVGNFAPGAVVDVSLRPHASAFFVGEYVLGA